MFSYQKVALFETLGKISRCVLVGGSVSWGMDFEVSKAYAKFRGALSAQKSCYVSEILLQHLSTFCHALCHYNHGLKL